MQQILLAILRNSPVVPVLTVPDQAGRRQDLIDSMNMSEGSAWLKSHPNLLQGIPEHHSNHVCLLKQGSNYTSFFMRGVIRRHPFPVKIPCDHFGIEYLVGVGTGRQQL